ncbi:hypothetical protein [Pseudodesulfovibrio sp.]|uniref:hypothetical protein n=1 Tax=unclassified Pseudodesulfovibrio TaxID=2661612 RepID=UPI003B00B6C3
MILDANQIASIRQRNDEELRQGNRGTHGYPAQTVKNLLHTIEALKQEKRKWKKLAQSRGKTLESIASLVSNADKDQQS